MPELIRFALVAAIALLASSRAFAVMVRAPCDTPFVFPEAALNVIVLPYSQPASLGNTTPEVGQQLGALVQFESLLGIAKFGSVGLIQIVGDPQEGCTPETVLQKLLGLQGGADAMLQPGHALIMVWGRIFESGSDLYLQSYIQFLRRDEAESIEIPVEGRALSGRLSSQSLACAPRKISLDDLDRIGEQYVSSSLLRTAPDFDADFVQIPETGGPYSFWITEVRGDWVQLAPMDADNDALQRGWVLARPETNTLSLRRRMPELALVEGIAGYLSARVGSAPRALEAADAALAQYLEGWRNDALLPEQDTAASSMALAVAIPEQLRGFIAVLRSAGAAPNLAATRDHFQRAAALMPYSGSARNLAAMAGVALAVRDRQPDRPPRRFVDELISAVGNDPENSDALANLAVVYDLVLGPPPAAPAQWSLPSAERETLTRDSDAVRALLSRQ
jgi:hypothetical protein